MELDAFNEEFKSAGKGKLKSYQVEHDTLSQASVESLMKQDIEYTSSLCGLDVRPPMFLSHLNQDVYFVAFPIVISSWPLPRDM